MCKDLSHAVAKPAKREEEGHDLIQIRVPHVLTKLGQQGLREAADPRKTSFNRRTKLP